MKDRLYSIRLFVCMLLINLSACESTLVRMQSLAQENDLIRFETTGDGYQHLIFERKKSGDKLFIFIEGDGTPWVGGEFVADDPTPSTVLAFDLMLDSNVPSLYVGRPCYFRLNDQACTGSDWTHGRFSERVVSSMAAAITRSIDDDTRKIVLIGYSGGGSLSMLLASRLANVEAVVTIAGLVDTAAWVAYHGYEPLTGSLNPASIQIPPHVLQIHLVGENDSVVPATQTEEAVRQWENTNVWHYSEFNHRCCWREQWQALFQRIGDAI